MASLRAIRGLPTLRHPYNYQETRLTSLHLKPSVYNSSFSTSAILHLSKKPSTTSTSTTATTSPSTTIVSTPTPTGINAPTSTFPAPIDIPPQLGPSAQATDKIKRIIATGRAYLTFYKTGLKNVFRNYRASIPLRKDLALPTYLPVSPPRGANTTASSSTITKLGRAQYQLIRRSARDVRRMIPFTMILIICGEFTPLIIPIFGSAITPATCRVPSQIAKERESASKRKYLALAAHASSTAGAGSGPQAGSKEETTLLSTFANEKWVKEVADADSILRACAVFGLIKSHEKTFGRVLVPLLYKERLRRYVVHLGIDDEMIVKGGGVKGMSWEEFIFGFYVWGLGDVASFAGRGMGEKVEREALERWLVGRK